MMVKSDKTQAQDAQKKRAILSFIGHIGKKTTETTLCTTAMMLFVSTDIISTFFLGGHAMDDKGNVIKRETVFGKEYVVKEPSLLAELVGLIYGGTVKRDEKGYPVTNEFGDYVKN